MIESNQKTRSPIVVIMGHIDHGKSTLLDYIRKTNVVAKEAGGITQHISAYEAVHKDQNGNEKKITFLDTPGHEAFQAMRSRGAKVADIAVLVVSAEDGVKAQTLEALNAILESKIPYIVCINKIDKPNANVEKTKNNLIESGIYIEGYGGDVPCVPISAKTGTGIPELLDMMLLISEIAELKTDDSLPAQGIIIESHQDMRTGISATFIITSGSLKKNMFVVAGNSISPTRIFQDFQGHNISEAYASSPVSVIGWDNIPKVGTKVLSFTDRREAEEFAQMEMSKKHTMIPAKLQKKDTSDSDEQTVSIPIIIKADALGSIEGIMHELEKINVERVHLNVIKAEVGMVNDTDTLLSDTFPEMVIVAFNTKIDKGAQGKINQNTMTVIPTKIIYEIKEQIEKIATERRPMIYVDEIKGEAKVLKTFSATKEKQVVGGRMKSGTLSVGNTVKIIRRDNEIGSGILVGLQQQKIEVKNVTEGEFGMMVQTKVEIAPQDELRSIAKVAR